MRQPRVKGRNGVLAAAVFGLCLGAPAAALVAVSPSNTLELRTSEHVLRARLSRQRLSGPGIELRRAGSELWGGTQGLAVHLSWAHDHIMGQVGPDALDLEVRPMREGVDVRGTFAGEDSDLHLWPTTISGTMGYCRYDLVLAGDQYSGWRSCGSSTPSATTLRLPGGLARLGNTERAAILATLLAHE